MHPNSFEHMKRCVKTYCGPDAGGRVVDIGSVDVNGSFRPIFPKDRWDYTGVDLEPGKNVDLVLSDPYSVPLDDGYADLVVSGSAFEHIAFFWLTWQEMCRFTKPGGKLIVIAPSRGPEHRYPIDAWRFYPDAMRSLAKLTDVKLLEAHTDWVGNEHGGSKAWGDTVGVFEKP